MKKIITFLSVLVIIFLVGLGFYRSYASLTTVSYTQTATSTQPTRLEQTQSLIDQLQKQRQNDPSFIAETDKELEALKQARITQSRLDALMIVQTQIDDEIASLKSPKLSK